MGDMHTPAPWVAASAYGLLKTEVLAPNEGRVVATVWTKTMQAELDTGRSVPVDRPDGAANLRLITSAPDMLDALRTTAGNLRSIIAASNHRQYDEWLVTVDAAIAKAEGR